MFVKMLNKTKGDPSQNWVSLEYHKSISEKLKNTLVLKKDIEEVHHTQHSAEIYIALCLVLVFVVLCQDLQIKSDTTVSFFMHTVLLVINTVRMHTVPRQTPVYCTPAGVELKGKAWYKIMWVVALLS